MFCSKCGAENKENAKFCRKCGAVLNAGATVSVNILDDKPVHDNKPVHNKENSNKGKALISGSVIVIIALLIVLTIIAQPKELILNGGEPMEVYVGDWDYITVSESSNKLTEEDFDDIIWKVEDESILSVNDMEVEAYYDEALFDETDGRCTCETNVYAEIKKGIRTWEGTLPVTVCLEPVDFYSGEVLIEPYDIEDSQYEVKPSDTASLYIYLQSQTDSANDMSFLVKKGEITEVDVPEDQYIRYVALGETWYGEAYLFGPYTSFRKGTKVLDFEEYTYTTTFGVDNGNGDSESIDSDEFPGMIKGEL